MSCNPAGHFLPTTALIMKPLMLAKDEPDSEAGGDHVSESNYDDRHSAAVYKSSLVSGINDDVDSDNEVSNDQHLTNSHHSLARHLRTTNVKLEAALMEFNEGLNLINKPNSNTNDDNNNTSSSYNSATTSNDNNNNNTSNSVKGDGINKTPRKLFECDVCNVSIFLSRFLLQFTLFILNGSCQMFCDLVFFYKLLFLFSAIRCNLFCFNF